MVMRGARACKARATGANLDLRLKPNLAAVTSQKTLENLPASDQNAKLFAKMEQNHGFRTPEDTFGDDNFKSDVLESDKPVLVDFWAPWCAPCRAIAPAVEELAKAYDGRVKVGKLNIDEHQGVPQQYGISQHSYLAGLQRRQGDRADRGSGPEGQDRGGVEESTVILREGVT